MNVLQGNNEVLVFMKNGIFLGLRRLVTPKRVCPKKLSSSAILALLPLAGVSQSFAKSAFESHFGG